MEAVIGPRGARRAAHELEDLLRLLRQLRRRRRTPTCVPCASACRACCPVLNKRVVEFAIRAGLATRCTVGTLVVFARKNYFYPDIPKGYQISQYELPICAARLHRRRPRRRHEARRALTRIHMEEDTGKNVHDAHASDSLVDFNRSGVPLLEIVSEPDMRTATGGRSQYLRQPALAPPVPRSLRRQHGGRQLPLATRTSPVRPGRPRRPSGTKVEIKNMNSFRAVERRSPTRIARQEQAISDGETIVQETRGWDADREETRSMRSRSPAHDYRYFPRIPDLLNLTLAPQWIESIRATMPGAAGRAPSRYEREPRPVRLRRRRAHAAKGRRRLLRGRPRRRSARRRTWRTGRSRRCSAPSARRSSTRALVDPRLAVSATQLAKLIRLVADGAINRNTAKGLLPRLRGNRHRPRSARARPRARAGERPRRARGGVRDGRREEPGSRSRSSRPARTRSWASSSARS
jgi:aspartyl-tRNA(Asn)/glutamyl-tRNA(Gln) amidotransferase subunit B